ncbi:hypothetical protein L6452_37493 [Arctium lappa]|uniref:Uncharacterized protein n=1 Tax=Arctium lappa TaxID=4217 RepID=A0ACB8Y4N3_ARCLA|nr:hypothetical protein L6452_37493 [Arctium lappa]
MDLRQEADEESQQEDSNEGENFEEPHNQNTDFEKEVTIRREEETWTEGSGKVRDGLKTCISPKEDKSGGNKSSHVSDTICENGGPGQSLLGVGDPNKNPANLISPLDSDTEIHNWRAASGTDNQKEGNKEGKQSKGGQSKVRGKEKIEAEKNKAKMKKGDIFGLGRGKVSFHLIKKKARSSGQKMRQKAINREGETSKQERSKKKVEDLCSSGSFAAISNELRSEDSSSDVLELGRQLGISWEGENLEKVQTGTQR